ncbi:polymorphic toxin-type HINT domain-containing protein [Acinetobacter sp. ESL0695]|uniref:polymorphic toxin-type HINT domain-containing protein n=1 Tax=Acinetobacter sp. ESL0695 TaxID=2983215 RepID=UPI0023F21161|nr:polymorphic toxin-type HINT domain-containing protein [Acinetobacter sp. ESL0695]WEV49328.1 polymorphic toxin-type HINT domain-containing protein [Acinetobacter sp. ESL0695]
MKEYGWLKASLLESGMILLDRNNNELKVVSQHLIPDYLDTVYNIEIEGFHTYHVGMFGTWVHNANCDENLVKKIQGEQPPNLSLKGASRKGEFK